MKTHFFSFASVAGAAAAATPPPEETKD